MESTVEPVTPKKRTVKKKMEDVTVPEKKKSETGQAKSKRGRGNPKVIKKEEVEEKVAGTDKVAEE